MTTKTTPTKSRRQRRPSEGAVRSVARSAGKRPLPMHEALSDSPLVPTIRNPSPTLTSRQQRFLQELARHMVRDNPWLRNTVAVATNQRVGTGPRPIFKVKALNDLFAKWRDQIDPRGDYGWTGWWRELDRELCITGDGFVRARNRIDKPEAADLAVPLQFELIPSEYCPLDGDKTVEGLEYVCGIARNVVGRPLRYMFYRNHPSEMRGTLQETYVGAREIMHFAERRLGCPRGEVPLASALMDALKGRRLQDTELLRKIAASAIGVAVSRPVDAGDDFELPSEDEVSDMIDAITLTPGGVWELPYGYDIKTFAPKDEPANFDRALRWNMMGICAAIGVLPHEVLFDFEFAERFSRYLNLIQERQASIRHDLLEFTVGNPMMRWFVDVAIASKKYVPESEDELAAAYDWEWEWDLIPLAAFKQEMEALQAAKADGVISNAYIQRQMFQLDPVQVAVERAQEEALQRAIAAHQAEFDAAAQVLVNDQIAGRD